MSYIHEFYNSLTGPVKHMFDVLFIGTAWAAFIAMIPAISAVLSLIWIGLRVYEAVLNIRALKQKLKD